jgi:hypothetical protein
VLERRWLGRLAALLFLLLLVAGGLAGGRSAALVDWREVRAVVLESDDWGLCGFIPESTAMTGLDAAELEPGKFPPVYWGSTLEDSLAVAALGEVLGGASGRDGMPAVMQPNYILSSLAWEAGPRTDGRWVARDLPAVPAAYARPGLWKAVSAAVAAGVWHPELHGRWHYDPARRREAALATPTAREAARRDILLFPGSERAWELGPWRPQAELAAELDGSIRVFSSLFGRQPRAVVAPDYRWDDRCEDLWLSRHLTTIQAKREQRRTEYGGLMGRARKLGERTLARQVHRDRVYLERNARFEPVQNTQPAAVTAQTAAAVVAAWGRGEPAIIETHRVNFAHLDPTVAAEGRAQLAELLGSLTLSEAGAPLYLVDAEVAGLQRHGTSWCDRGDRFVVRNLTRSRRLLVVPAGEGAAAGVVTLGPGETEVRLAGFR